MLRKLDLERSSNVLHLRIDYFRPEIQKIIKSFMESRPSCVDFYVCSMFAAVSSVLGKKAVLYDGKFCNSPSLWIVIVGDSGSGKSHPMDLMMAPVEKQDEKDALAYEREVNQYKGHMQGTDTPVKRQVILSDITPEGLYQKLVENPNGCILYRGEIRGFFDDFGRYNKSGEESNYIDIWDGKSFPVDRRSSGGSLYVQKPFLSMLGSIQGGEPLSSIVTRKRLESGFATRIMFSYPPHESHHYSDIDVDTIYVNAWKGIIDTLREAPKAELTLSPGAKNLYKDYFNELADGQDNTEDSVIRSLYSKMQIQVLRLSIINHYLCSSARGGVYMLPETNIISEDEMQYSIECMWYFETQYKKVLADIERGETHRASKDDAIREVWKIINNKHAITQAKYANILGIDRANLNRILNQKV